ncbi:hypothetical protein I4U23_008932 [Adineta vaga]|nr:hypothetical protein I4U23_008932 [Adineta vaga]
MAGTCTKLLLIIISLFIPPLAVWIARDKICSGTVSVNILLTLLGLVPGIIHAWIVICCCDNL